MEDDENEMAGAIMEAWANFEMPTPLERCEARAEQWERMYREATGVPVVNCYGEVTATTEEDGSITWVGRDCHALTVPEVGVQLALAVGVLILAGLFERRLRKRGH